MHRSVQAAVVAVLLALNAALIAGALHLHRKAAEPSPDTQVAVSVPPLPTSSASVLGDAIGPLDRDAGAVHSATPSAAPLLSAVSAVDAWRAVPGCQNAPTLMEHNGYLNTWNRMVTPDAFILSINMTGPNTGWVVGADTTCTIASVYHTTDRGSTWSKARKLGHIWFAAPTGVRTPSGDLSRPCGRSSPMPIALAPASSQRAVVICQRGVLLTSDGGATWQPTGQVTAGRAVDVTMTQSGAGVLLMANPAACPGVISLLTSDFGSTWTAGLCLKVANPPLAVALAEDGSGLLLALQAQYVTSDFGRTWS